jgi:hypothetical protein
MKKLAILLSAGVLALVSAVAQAQTRMFVRGPSPRWTAMSFP